MSWEIRPYRGLGPVNLGETRQSVHAALPEEPNIFSRSGEEDVGDEEYPGVGLFVYYDTEGLVEHIESFAAGLDSSPVFKSIALVGRAVDSVVSDLEKLGVRPDVDDGASKLFLDAGFAIFAPDIVESLSVFRFGYYDN